MTSSRSKYIAIPAVMAGALGASSAIAQAAEPTTAQLLEQIEQLQAKVQQMEARQEQGQALSARDVDATVEKVLADAEKRSQLMQLEGFTAGYSGGKFLIQDAAGNWVLQPYFQFQFRNVTNYREDGGGDGDDDIQHGFEVRRAKFGIRGNAINPDFTYNLRWETDHEDGVVLLEDAWVQYFFNDQMAIRAGQWKDNVFHEETVSSTRQLAVDRSLLNETLAGGATDYVQGVALVYADGDMPFRGEIALHDGLDTDNTNFIDKMGGSLGISPNWGASGRVEYIAQGDWKSYDDFTAMGNNETLLVIGAGFDYSEDGEFHALLHTVDVQWENADGLGVYAALIGLQEDLGGALDSLYDWGFLIQAGYMLNERWEVFGRYDVTILDDDQLAADVEDTYNEITLGMNYYINGHTKVTVDVSVLPDGAISDFEGIGVLEGDEMQIIGRAQFQLVL